MRNDAARESCIVSGLWQIGRTDSELVFKTLGEIAGGCKAYIIGHLGHGLVAFYQHLIATIQSSGAKQFNGRWVWDGFYLAIELQLHRLGVDTFEVRQLDDWNQPKDGLIIPGGESTTQGKLLHDLGLFEPIRQSIVEGPVFTNTLSS